MSLIINNIEILTPIDKILQNLQAQLQLQHINKLSKIEYRQNNAIVTCPFHKFGQERTPSCSILLKESNNIKAGTVHCFGCGYKASLIKFISDCLETSYRQSIDWLLNFSQYQYIENIRKLDIDIFSTSEIQNNYDILPKVTIEELKSYDYIHPYMFQRKLTDEIINKFEVGYDPKTDCLTFPVYVNGECLFIAKRKVKYKKFIMPEIHPKPIYGLDYITKNTVYVCESIINCLTLWSYGKQAIALFGTGSDYQIQLLNNSNIRSFVLCLDGDEAGRRGTLKLKSNLQNKLISILKIPDNKDINDLTFEEFNQLQEDFL